MTSSKQYTPPLRAKRFRASTPLPASFRGWPGTVRIEDAKNSGAFGLEVYGDCLSPGGARVADMATTLIACLVAADMMVLSIAVQTLEFFVGTVAGILGFYFLSKKFFHWLFSGVLWIRVFPDRIEIAGRRRFDAYQIFAGSGTTFRLDDHEKSVEEEFKLRQNPQSGRYYSNSQRLYLDHGRQPVFIADIYPKEEARLAAGRLIAIQEGLRNGIFD